MATGPATMPALSSDGWVTDPVLTADYLFSHYFLSDHSQIEPVGNATAKSFAQVVFEGTGSIPKTIELLDQSLTTYFGRYYTEVEVQIRESATSRLDPYNFKAALDIYVGLTDRNGVVHNLARLLGMENMKVVEIIKLNNGEQPD